MQILEQIFPRKEVTKEIYIANAFPALYIYEKGKWAWRVLRKQLTISFPSLVNVENEFRDGFVLGAGFSCQGSLDCQLVKFSLKEYGVTEPVYDFSIAELDQAGILCPSNFPCISKKDPSNKIFAWSFAPAFPFPFSGLSISLKAPPPTLDTVFTANVLILGYAIIKVE